LTVKKQRWRRARLEGENKEKKNIQATSYHGSAYLYLKKKKRKKEKKRNEVRINKLNPLGFYI